MTTGETDKPLSEAELRARVAAGSPEPKDYLELAALLKVTARHHEAASLYKQGLQLDLSKVDRARLAMELGSLLETGLGLRAEACSFAEQALSLLDEEVESRDVLLLRGFSESVRAHAMWLANASAGEEAGRAAVHWLERVARDYSYDPAAAPAYYELARLYNALGQPQRAIGRCQEYLRHGLGKHEQLAVLIVLAEALQLAGRLTEAETTTREAMRHADETPEALPTLYLSLGLVQRAGHHRAEVQASFETALRILRDHGGDTELTRALYWRLAELHSEAGNQPEAAIALQQLVTHYPEDSTARRRAYLWLGDCYAAQGMRADARSYYEQVLASTQTSEEERSAAREALAALAGEI